MNPEPPVDAIEALLALAHRLARERSKLEPLLRDLACLRDELARVERALPDADDPGPLPPALQESLRASGLDALAGPAATLREVQARAARLQALVAAIAATRGPHGPGAR